MASFGHPCKFQRISRLGNCSDVAQRRSTKLCTMFGRFLAWYIIYTVLELLPPDGILPGAKFTLRPNLAFSCIGNVTGRHSSSERQPNNAAWYKEWNYGTFAPRHFQQRALHIFRGRPSRWAQAYILIVNIYYYSRLFFSHCASKLNSITLAGSELAPNRFGASSEPAPN